MAIATVRVPIAALPSAAGSTSWLGSLGDAVDSSLARAGQDKSFDRLANQIGGAPIEQQQPGFLARLFGAQGPAAPQAAAIPAPAAQSQVASAMPQPTTAPIIPVDKGAPQGSTYQPFIQTVQNGATLPNGQKVDGVTNPYGLAAIAATGRAESGYSPQSAAGAWSDPSASGQAGTAGGVMSWRGPRLASLQAYAASKGESGNGSPQTQAEFLLQENPQTIQALNNAQSPQEAADIMAKAWAFKGYDQQGGEAARRKALTQNYYATQFAGQQQGQAAQGQQVASVAPAGVDPSRFASGPVAQGAAGLQTALGAQGDTTQPAAPYVDPQVTTAAQQPQDAQVAAAAPPALVAPVPQQVGPQTLAAGVTPVPKGGVSIPLIQSMLRDPNLRQAGLQLWQQNATGKTSDGWDFVKLDDGTLARANKQTGEVQSLGNFQSSKKELLGNGKGDFYDSTSGKWITPPPGAAGGGEYGLNPIYGTDATTGKTGIGQIGKDGSFHLVDTGGFQPVGNVSNTNLGTTVQTRDKAGNVIGTSAIDNAGKSADEATGKNLAANQQALPGVLAASNQLVSTIDSLTSDPHLDNMLGPVNSRLPTLTADGARVQSKMDQIGGQSFLQAYNSLKGSGAITDIEGEKATKSLNRLNTAQSPADYRSALKEFRDIVVQAASRARSQAERPSAASGASATPAGTQTKTGISWSVE